MPKEKKFFVLNDLQELATESDRFAELVPQPSILDEYLSLVKETALKIKTCTSLEDIVFPPDLKTVLVKEQRVIKNIIDEITETQRAHVHAEKNGIIGNETDDIKAGSGKVVPSKDKGTGSILGSILGASFPVSKNEELQKMSSSTASCNKINQEPPLSQIFIPKTEITNCPVKTVPESSSCLSQRLMNTPIMNTTFKLIDKTVILDSASSYNSNQKSKIEDSDLRITRSGTKQKLKSGESNGSGILTQSGSKSKLRSRYESNQENQDDLRITRSGTKQKLQNGESNGSRKLSRSGSKRKSSQDIPESNKKQKREVNGCVSKSAAKTAKSKQPRVKKNLLKPASLVASENKAKIAPVIVPTMKHNTSLVSKEKLIMEEIQKKEEKANENLKRVLAERQLKADENKKKRNEKMEKTLLRRLHMEKEKEERLEKKESECKKLQANAPKENIKQPVSKIKTKELIDQNTQGNSSGNSSALNQKDTNGTAVFKTPVRKLSLCDSETYDLTPPPDSSTYDFSDEEEDKPSGKLIPSWAQGVHLKLALTHQFYNPVKTEEIFGSVIQAPNLTEIFRIQKKEYSKRTSSAVWNSPPGNSFC